MELPTWTKLTSEELRNLDADNMDINLMNNVEVKPSSFGLTYNELRQISSEDLRNALNARKDESEIVKYEIFKDPYKELRDSMQKAS